ncbi:A disintegrin and metalloproteinase with thrombospondin motifs 6 isoform X2 [Cephus cinctus]|uniref:A disintegrin and metalloproteinase with thrombospondin motifs 6 isoform X2 n=1 Tax=Cephus cinctus TaxID=211228 RepID=A0AAJ7W787_CEPCN|nr:A disintegrin and metalloproteinase with thrombospondin motifs 6 isoform X2 [Cephus cinctus]
MQTAATIRFSYVVQLYLDLDIDADTCECIFRDKGSRIRNNRIMLKFRRLLVMTVLMMMDHVRLGKGRYSRNIPLDEDCEIVVPRKVRSDGRFISHSIPHHFKRTFYGDRARKEMTPDDALHYRLRINGVEHHLELYPNNRLVGPGAVLERRILKGHAEPPSDEAFLRGSTFKRLRDTQCHYQGGVREHQQSSALSTCYGLAGYIRTKRSWYIIEPMADHDFTKETEHPHILHRTSPRDFQEGMESLCNVTGKFSARKLKRAADVVQRNLSRVEPKFYTVELLLVLDKTLLDYHRNFDVENYVLTLFNMAAGLFHDVSLGIEMELTIVRIIRLEVEEDEMNLSVSKDAGETMKYFQEWQRMINPGDDSHPNHHDCAILLSRIDFCKTQSLCGFTGMSTVAGTCDPLRAAVVLRDAGLETGYHIAHHIGHTIGMSHDLEEENGCPGITVHQNGYIETSVMYPGYHYVTKKWSKCSQSYVKLYLEAGMGSCLSDVPQDHQFPLIDMLPGVMYNGDDQCRLRYRQDVRQCDLGITCETLKCAVPGKGCISRKIPPAEGTPCGEERWCYQMKCLMIGERPDATDGAWSAWSPWSRCSRTCGSGVASSERRCNHPRPSKGGAYCPGNSKRHKICATDPCEIGSPSFRDVQCAQFNDWVFPEDGKIHQWVGYNLPENLKASENPCVLFCLSETKLLTSLKPKVIDGTTCYRGIRDICIGGICKEIPCDLDMESDAVEDICGVCKGDGTSCTLKEGTISIQAQSSLKKVIDVPVEAKNIRVEEAEPTKSRIVVRSKNTRNVLIDGNRLGMFDVPGSKAWLGMIRGKQEALNIPGPITEELVILVYPKENVTLKYSLGLRDEKTRKPEFDWGYVDWSKCNAPCGPGEEVSTPRCIEKTSGQVDDSFCKNITKPDVKMRPCNQASCIPRWMIGDWQGCIPCTSSCKKVRAVKCIRPVGHGEQEADIISDSFCQGPKPKETEICNYRIRRCENAKGERDSRRNHQCIPDLFNRISNNESSMFGGNEDLGRASRERIFDNQDKDDRWVDAIGNTMDPFRGTLHSLTIKKRKDKHEDNVVKVEKINKGEIFADKEDLKNLTLTIILERDEDNNVLNFPKDFKPQPPDNVTDFTLAGMDAVKYIQRIQDEARTTSEIPTP